MKKIIIALFLAALALTSCGSDVPESSADASEASEVSEAVEASAPVELSGEWIEEGVDPSAQDASWFSAIISDGAITIHRESADMSALYWAGTMADELTAGEKFISIADHAQTDASLLASSADEKEFAFDGTALSFDFTMMGVTKTIRIVPKP